MALPQVHEGGGEDGEDGAESAAKGRARGGVSVADEPCPCQLESLDLRGNRISKGHPIMDYALVKAGFQRQAAKDHDSDDESSDSDA